MQLFVLVCSEHGGLCWLLSELGGEALGAEGTRTQPYAFPRTSGAKSPIVSVKILILIFLLLKVVLQAKLCKGGWCNLEGWSRLLRISETQKTTYILLQGVL